jgi:HD-GYP domain-containing protein (c-di-GMP phosphodiesterase class II)
VDGADASSTAWSPADEALFRVTGERHAGGLAGRERLVGAPFGLALFPVTLAIALFVDDGRTLDLAPAIALLAAFALTARIEFHTGGGYTVPTQLVFVPMLFAVPAAALPLVVGVGYVLARAPELVRQQRPVERVVGEFANAWYAFAPALVIVAAGATDPSWSSWPVYVAALAAQFAVDALVSFARYALAFGMTVRELLPEIRWAHRVDLLLAPVGLLAAVASRDAPYAWAVLVGVVVLIDAFARERKEFVASQLELANAYRGTALLLGDVVEGDDEYTGRHSRGVALLALDVADHLGLDDSARRDVEFAALLHDVGKVVMPAEIINKPGPLSVEEWSVMRTHTIEGQRMLDRVGGVLTGVGRIVRASHEAWDGSGYPDGLRGRQIPLAARVVSCCDAFNAITTDRPYRRARSLGEAVAELRAQAGSQFDPVVVDALIAVLGDAVMAPGEDVAVEARDIGLERDLRQLAHRHVAA